MVRRKDPFWEYAKDLKNGRFSCNFCNRDFAGGNSRIKAHLSGIRGRDIQICEKVPQTIQSQARDAVPPPTKRAKNVAASNNIFEGKSISGSSSLHMPNLCEVQDKSTVDQQLVKFLVSEGIRPRAIESPFFKNFVNGVAEHVPSYKLPDPLNITSKLAPNIKNEVEKYIQNVIKESIKTGCTLMYKRRWYGNELLLDFYAYTPIGVACIKTLKNPSSLAVDEFFRYETTWSSVMEVIGPTNVVQFIINDDDADDDEIEPIKDMFYHKYPWICLTRCSTVDIYSLCEEICYIPVVQCTIKVAKWIILYIYKYKVNILLRVGHKKDGFIDPDVFHLMSLLEVESELQNLEVSIGTLSNEWGKPLNDPQVAKFMQETKFIDYAIHSKEFWRQGKMVAQVMHTLVKANCLIYHDGPTLGYLYEMMERVQDAVEQCRESNAVLYDDIWEIFETFQSDIIHQIHAAAAFLNPIYMCSEKFKENDEMKNGVNHILEHLVEETEDFRKEEQLYRVKDSNVFTAEAMLMLKTYHPRIWWERYGNHLPVLQKYAIRILSQPCSFSLWRGDQLDMRDSDIDDTFKVNAWMMERYKSLEAQLTKPIIFDELGEVSYNAYDWENEKYLLSNASSRQIDDIIKDDILNDPTGSKFDTWYDDFVNLDDD